MAAPSVDQRGCVLRVAILAAGDYQVAGLPIPKGGRFNMSNPKSKVEWDIYRAKQVRCGLLLASQAVGCAHQSRAVAL